MDVNRPFEETDMQAIGKEPNINWLNRISESKSAPVEIKQLEIERPLQPKPSSSIVREYKFAEWEKIYGEKTAAPMSIRDRLRQKEQIVKETGRTHQTRRKDKGAR